MISRNVRVGFQRRALLAPDGRFHQELATTSSLWRSQPDAAEVFRRADVALQGTSCGRGWSSRPVRSSRNQEGRRSPGCRAQVLRELSCHPSSSPKYSRSDHAYVPNRWHRRGQRGRILIVDRTELSPNPRRRRFLRPAFPDLLHRFGHLCFTDLSYACPRRQRSLAIDR